MMKPISLRDYGAPDAVLRAIGDAPCFLPDTEGRSGAFLAYAEKDGGLYLKSEPAGSMKNAARMQEFLYGRGLAPKMALYVSEGADWLLSARAPGLSASSAECRAQPERLAEALGKAARRLHETGAENCPVGGLTRGWTEAFWKAYRERGALYGNVARILGLSSPEEAAREAEKYAGLLRDDRVVHGDLCLPNYMLEDFSLTGFVDLGGAGLGDRHYDLFWTLWSLWYNLKTNDYADAFLNAYGRADVDIRRIRACGCLCAFE